MIDHRRSLEILLCLYEGDQINSIDQNVQNLTYTVNIIFFLLHFLCRLNLSVNYLLCKKIF